MMAEEDRKKFGLSKGNYLRVHFKNTRCVVFPLVALDLVEGLVTGKRRQQWPA